MKLNRSPNRNGGRQNDARDQSASHPQEEQQSGQQQIEMFFHRQRPEVRRVPTGAVRRMRNIVAKEPHTTRPLEQRDMNPADQGQHSKHGQKEQVWRENPQTSANVKARQVDSAAVMNLVEQTRADQETADPEEDVDAK